ncbi:MAG: hypothetical protein IJ587_11570 [Synergistaceae bacterium]|nr:hypothetical protein [Synergistaceae bacterium]
MSYDDISVIRPTQGGGVQILYAVKSDVENKVVSYIAYAKSHDRIVQGTTSEDLYTIFIGHFRKLNKMAKIKNNANQAKYIFKFTESVSKTSR